VRTIVKESCDGRNLSRVERKWRHALVRASLANDFTNQVPIHVVCHYFGADQVRAAGARGVGCVTEAARLFELGLPPRDYRTRRRLRPQGRGQNQN